MNWRAYISDSESSRKVLELTILILIVLISAGCPRGGAARGGGGIRGGAGMRGAGGIVARGARSGVPRGVRPGVRRGARTASADLLRSVAAASRVPGGAAVTVRSTAGPGVHGYIQVTNSGMIKAFHPTWSGFRTVGRIYPNGELWQVHANGTPLRLVGELGARGTIIEIKGSLRIAVGILRVKVTGIHVDMRSGSSKGFNIIGRLRRGEKIEVEGYENGWFQISREDGLTGWIPASQVRTEVESNASYDSPFLSSFLPKGEIQAVWVEHNVEEIWRNGMRIHVKFTLDNSFQSECTAVVFFYSADGRPLKDFNREYCTTDGDVALPRTFTPEYESLLASDFTLFMPYDELHMVYGRHELKFKVMLHRSDVGFIAESAFQNFHYQK